MSGRLMCYPCVLVITIRLFPTTVHVHCIRILKVIRQRYISHQQNYRHHLLDVEHGFCICRLSPTVLLLLFMRSTLYCHCMEGYTCPYLELVYQYTMFKLRKVNANRRPQCQSLVLYTLV